MKKIALIAAAAATFGFAGVASAEQLTAPVSSVQVTQGFGELATTPTLIAAGLVAVGVIAIENADSSTTTGGGSDD